MEGTGSTARTLLDSKLRSDTAPGFQFPPDKRSLQDTSVRSLFVLCSSVQRDKALVGMSSLDRKIGLGTASPLLILQGRNVLPDNLLEILFSRDRKSPLDIQSVHLHQHQDCSNAGPGISAFGQILQDSSVLCGRSALFWNLRDKTCQMYSGLGEQNLQDKRSRVDRGLGFWPPLGRNYPGGTLKAGTLCWAPFPRLGRA